jgi:hypothetical protein
VADTASVMNRVVDQLTSSAGRTQAAANKLQRLTDQFQVSATID